MEKTNERDFHAETMGSDDSAPDSGLCEPHSQPLLIETPPSTIQDDDKEPQAAGQRMSPTKKRAAKVDLLEHQLSAVAQEGNSCGKELRSKLRKGTVDLHDSLSPNDSIDSMLAGVMVGIHNLTMECIAWTGYGFSSSREENLRYSIKGARTLAELAEVYEARRGRGCRRVTVGTVNVEQGGQAIVGNVEPQRLEPSPPAGPSTDESEE